MKMERSGSVAIMVKHRQEEVDYKQTSKLFFQRHPRNINLTNLLFEWIFLKFEKVNILTATGFRPTNT